VKIKVVHDVCGREVLVSQILQSQGHCPWDGKAFNGDYTAILAEALETAEIAGGTLENALEKIADMTPTFVLAKSSLLGPLETQVEHINRRQGEGRR
jgi:hypothetical protein